MADIISLGPLEKRASRIMSNGALYDLVQDMAKKVDDVPRQFDEVHSKLDAILEKLNARD